EPLRGGAARRRLGMAAVPPHHHSRHPPDAGVHGADDGDLVVPRLRLHLHHDWRWACRSHRGGRHVAVHDCLLHVRGGLRRRDGHRPGAHQRGDGRRLPRSAPVEGVGHLIAVSTPPGVRAQAGRGRAGRGSGPTRPRRGAVARHAVLVALGLVSLAPLYLFLTSSLKSQSELAENPVGLPRQWLWANFVEAWTTGRIGTGLLNSAVIVAGTVVLVCLVASCGAYALARIDVPGGGWVVVYLLVASSLPIQLFLVPLF